MGGLLLIHAKRPRVVSILHKMGPAQGSSERLLNSRIEVVQLAKKWLNNI